MHWMIPAPAVAMVTDDARAVREITWRRYNGAVPLAAPRTKYAVALDAIRESPAAIAVPPEAYMEITALYP